MSRARKMLVVATVTFFAACSTEGVTEPGSASEIVTSAATAKAGKPAGGECVTAVNIVGGDATSITLAITGVCHLQHLGRTTMTASQTVSTVTGAIANTTVYTAANGDRLNSSFVGQVISPPGANVTFIGTETYTGGTGRFAGATGSSALNGTAILAGPSGTGEYVTNGTIKY